MQVVWMFYRYGHPNTHCNCGPLIELRETIAVQFWVGLKINISLFRKAKYSWPTNFQLPRVAKTFLVQKTYKKWWTFAKKQQNLSTAKTKRKKYQLRSELASQLLQLYGCTYLSGQSGRQFKFCLSIMHAIWLAITLSKSISHTVFSERNELWYSWKVNF